MATIANLLVSLKADFGDADSAFGKLRDNLQGTSDDAENTKDSLEDLGKGGEETGSVFEEVGESAADFGKELLKLGLEALELTSIFEVLKESLEVSAELESAKVAMTAFTGSVGAATEVIENMETLAKSDALRFPEVVPAAQHMMALGFSAEATEKAIKAAGNASWALGQPLENISQRMALMAQSGIASTRMLRTLGVSSEEMSKVMGVSGENVQKVFKALDVDERLEVITKAMVKFGDQGVLQAETVQGKWIEMKNAFHEAFTAIGDALEPATKKMLDFGVAVASVMTDATKAAEEILKAVEAWKDMKSQEAETKQLRYGGAQGKQTQSLYGYLFPPEPAPLPAPSAPTLEPPKPTDYSAKAAPELAKENSKAILARIEAEEKGNTESFKLAREWTENQINAIHQVNEARTAAMSEGPDKTKAANDEEVRFAQERANRIGAIETSEAEAKKRLLQAKLPAEVASKYEAGPEGEQTQASLNEQLASRIKNAADIKAIDQNLASEQIQSAGKVTEASGKGYIKLGEESKKSADQMRENIQKAWDEIGVTGDEVSKSLSEAMKNVNESIIKSAEAGSKDFDELAKRVQAAKIAAVKETETGVETAYAEKTNHTLSQQITYLQKISALKQQELVISAEAAEAAAAQLDPYTQQAEIDEKINEALADRTAAYQEHLDLLKQIAAAKEKSSASTELESIGGSIAGAVSSGLFHTGRGGQDVGKQVTEALRNIGKQLLGDIMKKMIDTLIENTLATELNTLWTQLVALIPKPFGFAEGGTPTPHVPVIVGERGPELFVPHELGDVVPNHVMTKISRSSSATNSQSSNVFNIHGARDARETARQIATFLRNTSNVYSPATSSGSNS